jgi:putative transcriptional regulator
VTEKAKQTRPYRSDVAASVHEMMEGVHEAGLIDKQTMRAFDASCLSPAVPLAPEEIRAIREREHVSQPVFARYLNVSKNLVSDWERGTKRPGGPALRLLTVVRKNGLRAIG